MMAPVISKDTAALIIVLCTGTACGTDPAIAPRDDARPAEIPATPKGDTAAVVNGVPISIREVQRLIEDAPPNSPLRPAEALHILVRNELLAEEAARRGIDKDPLIDFVRKDLLAKALLKKRIEHDLTAETIPAAQLEACYEARKAKYDHPAQRRIVHFLAKINPGAFSKDEARAVAEKARAAAAGATDEADFRARMQPLLDAYGDKVLVESLPPFDAKDRGLVKPFVDAAFALSAPGDVSAPTATKFGQHILYFAEAIPAAHQPLASVREEVAQACLPKARREAASDLISDLLDRQKIFVYEDALNTGSLPP